MDLLPRSIHSATLAALILLVSSSAHAATTTLKIGGSDIRVSLSDGEYSAPRDEIRDWVSEAARAVTAYYGQFPVEHLTVRISPRRGDGLGGRAFGWNTTVRVLLGIDATTSDLEEDWVMSHEMTHMAFPDVSDRHQWIKEGLSVYVQRVARARVGDLDVAAMWGDLMRNLPQGLPRDGDQGLDNTHTWGRTYWGGALFAFLADVQIRRRTDNRQGLQDALRAIVAAGGTLNRHWSIERAFQIGDKAVGVPVLMPLYERMKDAPYTPNLKRIWERLGVERTAGGIKLNENAPLAGVRRAIIEAPAHVVTAEAANSQ